MTARPWVFIGDDGVDLVASPCACMVTVDQLGAAYMEAVVNMLADHTVTITDCEGGDEATGRINGQPMKITITWKFTRTDKETNRSDH